VSTSTQIGVGTTLIWFFPPAALTSPFIRSIVSDNVLPCKAVDEQHVCDGEGFILAYSTTSRESFAETAQFRRQILQNKGRGNFSTVLVGNMALSTGARREWTVSNNATRPRTPHLLSRLPDWDVFHVVSRCSYETDINELTDYAEGRELAKHLGCIFMEISTKQPSSVDQAFDSVVRKIRKYDKVCLSRVDFKRD
jgi:GTPase KRas protein